MDNFTHSLAGWALGQAGLKAKSRKGLAALILGANAPDIDVFFGHFPWEPLAMHRGFTHSLVGGVLVIPVLLWGLLLLLDAWQLRRGTTFKSGLAMHRGWLLALCFIGALTHPLLDLQTTYSVQLLSPFSGAWFHSDSLFIIDVALWAILPLSIAISRMREKQGRDWRRPALIGVVIAIGYIFLNLGLSRGVRATLAEAAEGCGGAEAIFTGPRPARPWERDVIWTVPANGPAAAQSRVMVGKARFSPLTGWSGVGDQLGPACRLKADGMRHPIVRQAIAENEPIREFLRWSVLPVARVTRQGCTATVEFGDARYTDRGARGSFVRRSTVRTCA